MCVRGSVKSAADGAENQRRRVLAPGYRIFGALGAACDSLMLGWESLVVRNGQTRHDLARHFPLRLSPGGVSLAAFIWIKEAIHFSMVA